MLQKEYVSSEVVTETSEINKLKLLNSILIKELNGYKYENSKLKQENETLKIENEEINDKNEKLMAGNIILKSDYSDIKNQFDSQTTIWKQYDPESNITNGDLKILENTNCLKEENNEKQSRIISKERNQMKNKGNIKNVKSNKIKEYKNFY